MDCLVCLGVDGRELGSFEFASGRKRRKLRKVRNVHKVLNYSVFHAITYVSFYFLV